MSIVGEEADIGQVDSCLARKISKVLLPDGEGAVTVV